LKSHDVLPAALDLIAFMAIWTSFTGPKAEPQKATRKWRRKPKAKAKAAKPVPLPTDVDHLRIVK
jgi:hypothetical protein